MNEKTSISSVYPKARKPVDYKIRLSCSNVFTRWRSGMFKNSRNNW